MFFQQAVNTSEDPVGFGVTTPTSPPALDDCENYAVVTLFFLDFPYLLQDLLS